MPKRIAALALACLAAAGIDEGWAAPEDAADCGWTVSVSGHSPAIGEFSGDSGGISVKDSDRPPLDIDAVVQDDDLQPRAPWMLIRLQTTDYKRIMDPASVGEIHFALPDVSSGDTGEFRRIWGTLHTGPESHDGNADYLRRDLVGLPEGSGIGHLLTSNVVLTRNDGERVEGNFEARFLNGGAFRQLGPQEQHPLGVGIHPIEGAQILASGSFSLPAEGRCGSGRRGLRRQQD